MSDSSPGEETGQAATVRHERLDGGAALVTLDRPGRGNGVVPELTRDFLAALDELEADLSVRALVLTGAGQVFCAGADLVEMDHYLRERLRVEQEPYNVRALAPVIQRIVSSRLPVIAALNGAATAGGLDLAMACDIRFASTRAKLGETYVGLGLSSGGGGSWFLPRLVGSGIAAELALTGELIDAGRAREIGLVNRVCEPDALLEEAIALARTIAARPRRGVEATKQALRSAWQIDLPGMLSAGFWTSAALQATDDVAEGVRAALEKREPRFNRPPDRPRE